MLFLDKTDYLNHMAPVLQATGSLQMRLRILPNKHNQIKLFILVGDFEQKEIS